MMYSAMLLASLLASAHGFAATPTGGEPSPPPSPPELECSANEEKFFVYSVDPSLVFPFVASINGPSAPPNGTEGLVGNTWQGMQLSITQGDTTITQAGGKPLTVTSPNTLESGGFNVVSEDFCLGYGNWTVRTGSFAWGPQTHPGMGSYDQGARAVVSLRERRAPGAPINVVPVGPKLADWGLETLDVDVYNFQNNDACNPDTGYACSVLAPFEIRWAIFPSEKQVRDDAEASVALGVFGMVFIVENFERAMVVGEVDYERVKVVPWNRQADDYAPPGARL